MEYTEVRDYMLSVDFSGNLDTIAKEHNCEYLALRKMVEEIFKNNIFRYHFGFVRKDNA